MPAHPPTGPGAEGGGGWPMHATAQPWHAEGRPLATEALRIPSKAVAGGCSGAWLLRQSLDALHWTLAWAKAASTTSSPHQRL